MVGQSAQDKFCKNLIICYEYFHSGFYELDLKFHICGFHFLLANTINGSHPETKTQMGNNL